MTQHIYPTVGRAHVTDGSPCWCHPWPTIGCPEDDKDEDHDTCWRCRGSGLVTAVEGDIPVFVIHHAEGA